VTPSLSGLRRRSATCAGEAAPFAAGFGRVQTSAPLVPGSLTAKTAPVEEMRAACPEMEARAAGRWVSAALRARTPMAWRTPRAVGPYAPSLATLTRSSPPKAAPSMNKERS
jgi:hypothetical protein